MGGVEGGDGWNEKKTNRRGIKLRSEIRELENHI